MFIDEIVLTDVPRLFGVEWLLYLTFVANYAVLVDIDIACV